MWDPTVSVPNHCLSFYFPYPLTVELENHLNISPLGSDDTHIQRT